MLYEAIPFVAGFISLIFAVFLIVSVKSRPAGNQKMNEIANAIKEGSMAYLKRQYRVVAVFVVILSVLFAAIGALSNDAKWYGIAISFIAGAVSSAFAGYVGMSISVIANVRTAESAKKGLDYALDTAFKGGAVTGFILTGIGTLGVALLYYVLNKDLGAIIGYGFGASLIALFARVGGGIYTKAADVGADLVGKVEKKIPEDDPRNPAVIADNVGDNVGDCAGMAADVFESYVVTIIACMILGVMFATTYGQNAILFPLVISGLTIFASIAGTFFVKLGKNKDIMGALNKGIFSTGLISVALLFIATYYMFGKFDLFFASVAGFLVAIGMELVTEHYTARHKRHVYTIAKSSQTGAGTNVITGLAVGLRSTRYPVLIICGGMLMAYLFAGIYGIALAAMAMISMAAIIISVDCYGPITDNAGGIAEMAGLPPKVREITDELDAIGNTTKAVTKGFAIGSAALAALSLFAVYVNEVEIARRAIGITEPFTLNIMNINVTIGLFVGGMLPFLFSAYCMRAVGNAAMDIVNEVRRQFKEIKGLMQGTAKPDYAKCVDISTRSAQKELIRPALVAVVSPLLVGFIFGAEALGGLLAGVIVTGLLLALMMTTGGAAWDNAKKYIEQGNFGGKGTDAHAAAVVGDTVGDPFKDTAGPSLNALIKVVNMISLIFASLIVGHSLISIV